MRFVIATLAYPVLIGVLAIGAGLLVDRVAGRPLPGVLIPPVGLGLLVAVAELCANAELTAPFSPVAVAAIGLAGYAVSIRRLSEARPDRWAIAAAVAAYLIAAAPVLLAGRATIAAYLLDTTVAFHITGADYLIQHATNFDAVPDSAFRGMLLGYFGRDYPTGGQVLLGATGRLVATERIWLFQSFLSVMLAFCALPLYHLARSASVPRPMAAIGATVAAVPALVYAYAQMGAIKELTALVFVLMLGSLLVILPTLLERGARGAVVPGVVCAAGVGAIGFAFLPWVGATGAVGLALIALGDRRDLRNPGRVAAFASVLVVVMVVLALPSFEQWSRSADLANSFSTKITDPGNLLGPLKGAQMFGIWLGGTHRIYPAGHVGQTYLLIGVAAASGLLGAVFLLRRRLWSLAAFFVVMGVVWVVLTRRGASWTDAKLLVITSPALMLLVLFGVENLRVGGRKLEATLLGAAIALGVLASNAYTFHATNLLPTARYEELMEIGDRFDELSPTLTPEFDEFYFYALPEMASDGPGNASATARLRVLRDGTGTGYGHSYDIDQLPLASVQHYEAIVVRRRPDASRPPMNFELAFRGIYYDVWQKVERISVLEHEPAGGPLQPASVIPCTRIHKLAERAERAGAELAYVERPKLLVVGTEQLARFRRPAWWGAGPLGIGMTRFGVLDGRVRVPATGRYRLWLEGDFSRALVVSVDGRRVGVAAGQTGNEGNYARPFDVNLAAGRHRLQLERGGRSLAPSDGTPSRLLAIVLEPRAAPRDALEVKSLPASGWRRVCGRTVDWVEAVRGP